MGDRRKALAKQETARPSPATCAPNANPTAPFAKATARAVLVAIAIPVFTGQLEKAREATDAANIRSAYGVVQAAALTQETNSDIAKNNTADITYKVDGTTEGARSYVAEIVCSQQQDGWQSGDQKIGGIELAANSFSASKKTAVVTYAEGTGDTTITWK